MQTDKRLIDANALEDRAYEIYVHASPEFKTRMNTLKELIDNAPTIDAAPVVHGAWMTSQLYDADGNAVYIHRHQGCNYEIRGYKEHGTPYCPNCGAKMDAKEET